MLAALRRSLHSGLKIPELSVVTVDPKHTMGKFSLSKDVSAERLFTRRKIVLFGFPGCFTPTCTNDYVPQFVSNYDKFVEKGYDVIGLTVNDPFVVKEFAEEL
jgi:peroxiredoxin